MRFEPPTAFAILERTPRILDTWLRDLSGAWVWFNEGAGSWSPFDILGHLIHGERTDWVPRARLILEHGPERPFEPFDRFAQYETTRGRGLDELLDEFARLRADNLHTVSGWELSEANLAREGTHPEFGRVTLKELLSTWVVHDLGHLGQIARIQAKQLGGEAGPWQEYLPILRERDQGAEPTDTRQR